MNNTFPYSRIEVADSQGRKHVLVIASNNKTHLAWNGGNTMATFIAMIDLDANTYKNDDISE